MWSEAFKFKSVSKQRRGTHFYYFVCPLVCSRAQADPRQKHNLLHQTQWSVFFIQTPSIWRGKCAYNLHSNDLQFYPASLFLPLRLNTTQGPSSPTSLAPLDFFSRTFCVMHLSAAEWCTRCPWIAYYLQFCSPSFSVPPLVS